MQRKSTQEYRRSQYKVNRNKGRKSAENLIKKEYASSEQINQNDKHRFQHVSLEITNLASNGTEGGNRLASTLSGLRGMGMARHDAGKTILAIC